MEGKFLGIPLIIIVLALFIALLIDVPLVLLHTKEQQSLNGLTATMQLLESAKVATPQASPSPTLTPSPTPSEKPGLKMGVVSSESGRVR